MSETYYHRDIILLSIGYQSYSDYLVSQLWTDIRARAREAHGTKCRLCKSLSVVFHHMTYRREVLLGEDLSGLVPLCDRCHYKVEFNERDEKRSLEDAKAIFDKLVNPKRGKRCKLCGSRLRKKGGACRACNGTGVTNFPLSRKAKSFLRGRS